MQLSIFSLQAYASDKGMWFNNWNFSISDMDLSTCILTKAVL